MRSRRTMALFLALAAASVAAYVAGATFGGEAGFPLDDAWIHQTYARNLAASGQLAYVPGQPSAGSTSPLWTLLVAAGYALNVDYRLWTFALGAVSLAWCAWFAARLCMRLWPHQPRLALAAGLACLFEWHLVWAAASGMETVLFAALALAVFERAQRPAIGPGAGLIFGALCGLLTVTRPEGLLIVALAAPVILARGRVDLAYAAASAVGFLFPAAPAAWLNFQASGSLFPNTFYAKQQEYAVYLSRLSTWLPRAADVLGAPFVGAQILLLPGLLAQTGWLARSWRDRASWGRALPIGWLMAHILVYVARLPVTYQHGRYLMPVIPIVIVFGLHGSGRLLRRLAGRRLLRRAAIGSLIGTTAAFWAVGAGAYRADVNIVQNELVAAARWIEANTAPDALIAAHDIGAMGYFARRPILDLAGLISPEVIPIIRDEPALLALIRARRAGYLTVPPGFYQSLPSAPGLHAVFEGDSPFALAHWRVLQVR